MLQLIKCLFGKPVKLNLKSVDLEAFLKIRTPTIAIFPVLRISCAGHPAAHAPNRLKFNTLQIRPVSGTTVANKSGTSCEPVFTFNSYIQKMEFTRKTKHYKPVRFWLPLMVR